MRQDFTRPIDPVTATEQIDWPTVLDKLGYIQTLARRAATPAEAEAAAAALTKLLVKYNLSQVELDRRLGSRTPPNYVKQEADLGTVTNWRRELLSVIAHHTFCRSYWDRWGQDYLVGERDNITAVQEMLRHFEAEILRLADAAWRDYAPQATPFETVRAWKERYRLGCIAGLDAAMAEARTAAVIEAPNGSALIHFKDAEVDGAFSKFVPNARADRRRLTERDLMMSRPSTVVGAMVIVLIGTVGRPLPEVTR